MAPKQTSWNHESLFNIKKPTISETCGTLGLTPNPAGKSGQEFAGVLTLRTPYSRVTKSVSRLNFTPQQSASFDGHELCFVRRPENRPLTPAK